MNKTFSLLLALLLVVMASSFVNNENEKNAAPSTGNQITYQSVAYTDSIVDITDVFTGVKTRYDLQANGVTQHLVQDSGHPDTLHGVFMQNLTPGIPGNDRRSIYLVSTNRGMTWINKGSVPISIASGFPSIDLMSDGKAVIGCHAAVNSPPLLNSIIAIDSLPLAGSFKVCDPGQASIGTVGYTMIAVTGTNKISFLSSFSVTLPPPVSFSNVLSSSANCTFTGWQDMSDIATAGNYSLARAANGTIGLAYLRYYGLTSEQGYGDVRFIESTDEGLTWSSPVTIYDAQTDSCFQGALAGVDLVYIGNVPKVTFTMAWIGFVSGYGFSYYRNICSKIVFWSPNINGGNLVIVADSTNTPCNPVNGVNDVFTSMCRSTIGKSVDERILFCSYNVARPDVLPPDSTNYFDIYLSWSADGGATWSGHKKLTNFSGPLRDCRYPCLSPSNDNDANYYYANIEYQNDSVPGSRVNGARESLAEQHFIRVKLMNLIGVKPISSGVPQNYILFQNYPNPFNPSTTIEYGLSKSGNVKLTVYDISGKEVKTLVQGFQSAGYHSAVFETNGLASGVYFYRMEISDGNKIVFTEAKKMLLVK